MTTELREILQEWAKYTLEKGRTDWLFTNYRGERLQAEKWAKWKFQDLCVEAGLGKRNFHWLRDTFATEHARHGTDPGFTQQFMGHADFGTTYNKYFKPLKEQKKICIVLGGALQILFGVKGNRWNKHEVISKFFNQHWIKPLPHEVPNGATIKEVLGCLFLICIIEKISGIKNMKLLKESC